MRLPTLEGMNTVFQLLPRLFPDPRVSCPPRRSGGNGRASAALRARAIHLAFFLLALGGASFAAPPSAGQASASVRQLTDWVTQSGDHGRQPFIVIDKKDARLFVFAGDGRLRGSSAVLLGSARGDDTVPGIGERPLAQVLPHERTTPAGRFTAEHGINLQGEDIIWIDYDAAVSMHRVRAGNPAERRLQRLASPTPDDNRISYGCVNVPASFYDRVLRPAVGEGGAVVYVLPETRPARDVFGF